MESEERPMSEKQTAAEQEVRVHIDQHRYESPNPTTGSALYALGNVAAELALYREVNGNREDEPVERDAETIRLKQDEHFHSGPKKTYTIIVNGQKKTVAKKRISFDDLVKIAFPVPPTGENILYTISYEDGPPANPQGSLKAGETVLVKTGMIFNVKATDKS
jgi:hypothetical protein